MVLLVGATGQLGARIARELLSRRIKVRALVRPSSPSGSLRRMGAEIVAGDLKDPSSLAIACAGADTVITTANTARRGGGDTVDSVDRAGTRALVDAARDGGAGHFVYMSVYGASPASPVPFLAAKGESEQHLRGSGLAWTILAADAFMESWPGTIVGARVLAGQPVVIVGEGRRRHSYIAEHDVAQFVVAATTDPAARNRHLAIGGPAAHSWRDVIATYERVLGAPIDVRYVQPGERVDGVPEVLLGLLAMSDTYDSDFDSSGVASEFGVTQTALEQWVRASLASARRGV
jgi:NADH dehydrogenase